MKKIINGKRYDTNTANEMGGDSYEAVGNFHHWEEILYRKNTGEFFLHGIGGPASKYAISVGMNEWSGGEKIIPLSVKKAQEWAEEHLDADEYEAIFGEVTENEKKVVSFSLPESTIKAIRRNSAEKGISMSEYVASLVK